MDRSRFSTHRVGNDFFVPTPRRLQTAAPIAVAEPAVAIPAFTDSIALDYELENIPTYQTQHSKRFAYFHKTMDFVHHYSIGAFAVMFLIVGSSATQLVGNYYSSQITKSTPVSRVAYSGIPLAGLNMRIPADQLDTKVQAIANQPLTISMGAKQEAIPASTIKSWLSIVTDKAKGTSYIHVKANAVTASLASMAKSNSYSPKDQVTITHSGVSKVVVAGSNGLKVGDTSIAAKNISQHLLAGGGLKETIPTQTVPFNSVTPAAFTKMIEVNLVSKQMYLYEKGVVVKQYAISAGAPSTPTPTGQFKIFSQLAKQDMKGFNPDGSKYFQPNVKWISYFAGGGYAIHGNYWRPSSYFGNINSSHGCVSLPDHQAQEVYKWTPNGTTVIIRT